MLEGRLYIPPKRLVSRQNEAGERVRVEAPRRVRKGWFEDAAGHTYFRVQFGGRPLELAKGKTAIEVGVLANLPATIDALIAAVRAGELDQQLIAAAEARGHQLRGRKPKAA